MPPVLQHLFAIIGAIAALIAIWAYVYPRIKRWLAKYFFKDLPKELFSEETIESATCYYLPPYCSYKDPTLTAEAAGQKKADPDSQLKLFDVIDEFINKTPKEPYLWLLSDSGTGKSAFVLNYYARNRHRLRWKRKRLTAVALGVHNVEEYVAKIEKKEETVLFLDGFDEDTKAAVDYEERFTELTRMCKDFKRLIITCRSQFFPNPQAIPCETDIKSPGPIPLGGSKRRSFLKLYIARFTNKQVEKYFSKRFSILRLRKRRQAFELTQKIPELTLRPMLLTYVPELLDSGEKFTYTFELYEAMVKWWIHREDLSEDQKKKLREFSERLAVELYTNRQKRGEERIKREELLQLAEVWGMRKKDGKLILDEVALRSRSLLNHDVLSGYYKFAHRSIMEYLFVKRLINKDPQHIQITRTAQMNAFLLEMFKAKWPETTRDTAQGKNINMAGYPLKLRAEPRDDFQPDPTRDIRKMLREWGFFESFNNQVGTGILHLYKLSEMNGHKVVMDYATGLMWQQSGSEDKEGQNYVQQLNHEKFAGYSDWRLPTLEEAMSLMEPEKQKSDLYIDPVFDQKQRWWIWTADRLASGVAWAVGFSSGRCGGGTVGINYGVRAVRSGQ